MVIYTNKNLNSVFIHKVSEQFVNIELPELELAKLREEIFSAINANPDLDSSELNHHLIEQGYKDIISLLLNEDVYVHASFARPTSSIQEALVGWQDILGLLQHRFQLKYDEQQMIEKLKHNLTTDEWTRFLNLKKQVLVRE